MGGGKRKREDGGDDTEVMPDDYATRMSEPGKKRVNENGTPKSLDSESFGIFDILASESYRLKVG